MAFISMAFIFIISFVSAVNVAEFYYSPTCPHCQQVEPLINLLSSKYNVDWKFYDITKGSYNVDGVPTLIFDKSIKLQGSSEIPRYAECYLKEQSNLNCQTKPANTCTNDWFIR